MAGFDRTARIAGPAKIDWNGVVIYTKGDIQVKLGKKLFDIPVDAFGTVDSRVDDRDIEITFTPDGRWAALGGKTVLFPGGTKVIGASWIGATDLPLVITPLNGKPVTFGNAFLKGLPSLLWSAVNTLIGPVTFRAININAAEWSNAASIMSIGASAAFTDFTGYAASDILTKGVKLSWTGKTGFTSVDVADGIAVDFELQTEDQVVDAYGVVDVIFSRLDVTVKCKPMGVTEDDIITALALQNTGAARGASNNAGSADILIKDLAGATLFTANSMNFADAGAALAYGARTNRTQELVWKSSREFSAGALVAPFVIA